MFCWVARTRLTKSYLWYNSYSCVVKKEEKTVHNFVLAMIKKKKICEKRKKEFGTTPRGWKYKIMSEKRGKLTTKEVLAHPSGNWVCLKIPFLQIHKSESGTYFYKHLEVTSWGLCRTGLSKNALCLTPHTSCLRCGLHLVHVCHCMRKMWGIHPR